MFPILGTIASGWYSLLLSWVNRASRQNFSSLQWPACYQSYDTIDLFRVCQFASSRENEAPRAWFSSKGCLFKRSSCGEFLRCDSRFDRALSLDRITVQNVTRVFSLLTNQGNSLSSLPRFLRGFGSLARNRSLVPLYGCILLVHCAVPSYWHCRKRIGNFSLISLNFIFLI